MALGADRILTKRHLPENRGLLRDAQALKSPSRRQDPYLETAQQEAKRKLAL
jgi:hypothetical protein